MDHLLTASVGTMKASCPSQDDGLKITTSSFWAVFFFFLVKHRIDFHLIVATNSFHLPYNLMILLLKQERTGAWSTIIQLCTIEKKTTVEQKTDLFFSNNNCSTINLQPSWVNSPWAGRLTSFCATLLFCTCNSHSVGGVFQTLKVYSVHLGAPFIHNNAFWCDVTNNRLVSCADTRLFWEKHN